MIGKNRLIYSTLRALQVSIIVILCWVGLASPQPASAQVGLCARQLSGTFTINGVVARGMSTGSCAPDSIWATVGPAQFTSVGGNDAFLYVAHNTTNNHLYFGIDLKGDKKLSNRDVVMLFFNVNNNTSWDSGDIALRIAVSNADPALEVGEVCNQTTGPIAFYSHNGTEWLPDTTKSATAKVAYDLSSLAEGGADPEDNIWNLEIDMPVFTSLNLTTGFGLGAYIFVDDGSGGPNPAGPVLQYPAGINSSIVISDEDDVGFAQPTSLNALSTITANNACFDLFLSPTNGWQINGSSPTESQYRIYRKGQLSGPDKGLNTFRVRFKYVSTSGGSGILDDSGKVQLDLMAFNGGSAPNQKWTKEQAVNVSAFPQEYTADFKYQFDPLDPAAPPSFGTIVSSNDPNDFVCSDTTLVGFAFNHDTSNDNIHLNHNFFKTSESTQDVSFFGDGLPEEAFDENGVAKILLQMETYNEPKTTVLDLLATNWVLVLLVIGLILVLLLLFGLRRRRPEGAQPITTQVALLVASIILVTGCIMTPFKTARWEFENGRELGIEPVKDKPGWYEMPMKADEIKVLRLKFVGMPLPYKTETRTLKPADGEAPNVLTVPVNSGGVVTVVAFGEVDPDGQEGPLGPTSSTGFTQEGGDGFLLQGGYYQPNQYTSALIGSFDDFKNSFVVGRNISAIVPEGAQELKLAVNAPQDSYQLYTGQFEIYTILTEAPSVPTHTYDQGDATYRIPPQLPMWDVLTSVNMYTYYPIDDIRDGQVVGTTLHAWGDAHFNIYEAHVGGPIGIPER